MRANLKIKKQVLGVLVLSDEERKTRNLPVTKADISRTFGVSRPTIDSWEKKLPKNGSPEEIIKQLEETIESKDIKEKEEVLKKLYTLALEGSVKAAELLLKAKGYLIEKREDKVTIELSADEIARRNLNAERENQDFERGMAGYRVETVQAKPQILSNQLCLYPEQEHSQDDKVDTVGLPTRSA